MRKEAAAKIRETKVAMAQLAGVTAPLQSHTTTLATKAQHYYANGTTHAVESFLQLPGVGKCCLTDAACLSNMRAPVACLRQQHA